MKNSFSCREFNRFVGCPARTLLIPTELPRLPWWLHFTIRCAIYWSKKETSGHAVGGITVTSMSNPRPYKFVFLLYRAGILNSFQLKYGCLGRWGRMVVLNGDNSTKFQKELQDKVRRHPQHRWTADRLRACARPSECAQLFYLAWSRYCVLKILN